MTNIVDFEEELKLKSDKSLTDNLLDKMNRIYDAKFSGALNDDEFAKAIMMLSKMFANQVKKGKRNEEDVDSFETLIPNDSKYFIFNHKYLKEASDYARESNTDALMQRETWDKLSQPVDGYSKGLKRVA